MLTITATPNQAGVKISGDYFDLDELNMAIYRVIGEEGKYYDYQGARMRILGMCYEIRHAAQGDRNIESVFNGLHEHTKVQHGFIAPAKNIYFSAEVLWPEVLFAVLALKDFAVLYAKEQGHTDWDLNLPVIAKFQSLVLDCLQGHVPDEVFSTVREAFSGPSSVEEYAIQYIDMLNLQIIDMEKADREKILPAIAVKVARQDKDYQAFRSEVLRAAGPGKQSIHEIRIGREYPENINW
ncbi:hypothetical protein B0X71_16125 [Planococcus lenghuensis]|uniref:Uncharacterized protein n=1 Tax=Planococcus lenghuensis TaxID=2213202 RepID=A0A1Q2L336_9BACL|nr:hypothetical protein B0X71_16125 [Planococcus lenghuensis]